MEEEVREKLRDVITYYFDHDLNLKVSVEIEERDDLYAKVYKDNKLLAELPIRITLSKPSYAGGRFPFGELRLEGTYEISIGLENLEEVLDEKEKG